MRIEEEKKLDYDSVLIRPKRSELASRKEVDLYREFSFRNALLDGRGPQYKGIPIMASNMDGVGTFKVAEALSEQGLFTCLVKNYDESDLCHFFNEDAVKHREHVAYSMGIAQSDYDKFKSVYSKEDVKLKYICVDVANGYSERFSGFIKRLRDECPGVVIIAGNVVTGEMTEELILSGADIVKVGIGPGSVCTTRIQTGVGYPQVSAVIECADAAHGLGGHVIADGGCTNPGDVAKAFAAGADFVMLGGMLAAHDECAGEVIEENNGNYKVFYGMSSRSAQEKYYDKVADYRASEGKQVKLKCKGPVEMTIREILGGLRSAHSYIGATTIKNFPKCCTFVRCTQTTNEVFANLS